ncbi:deoxyguanosinetriphosphate triphosphohydrolase [Acidaminobacter hydrogenoformans]|uniref:Deoxyguanosinetriphosphate triphosphohydrolase-like protein n=1 Tax=Acidaminobacter hydrogenoformans DSM 2784 TaxID=1120920 RepID=A0A1G5RSS1_9FIRM|nr:deoxyguanosinetriphosphate triphosphohydrolase [Acidaminobacter hydrogenoformans]SCZ77145.1 dGTPase [Acidaminobacter hydrogenoformans DSM 2784]
MSIRERTEAIERVILSEHAMLAKDSLGRLIPEDQCAIRTAFQRDRDRIQHSKAFRRLKHKTQVFLSPEGDHYRTRLTHTLDVSQIARTIARALRLNEDLTEAIALGHDLGHTPFGHCGEMELDQIHPGGFDHNAQSLRVVDLLEIRTDGRRGLNLTHEVRDGILSHSGGKKPQTLEGQAVSFSDRIAYINHDIDDALRAGVLHPSELPEPYLRVLGKSHSQRINTLIIDVVNQSRGLSQLSFSPEIAEAFIGLRQFMFDNVYLNLDAKKEEKKARVVLRMLYDYYRDHPVEMPEEYFELYQGSEGIEAVKDYVSGMTDRYAVLQFQKLFVPDFWT